MGILDKKWILHDSANCFASGADFPSTDYVDTLSAKSDIGTGLPFKINATLKTAVTGGTSIQGVIADCDTPTGTYQGKVSGEIILVADALAGKVLLDMVLPSGLRRYIKVLFRNVGANAAGTADAYGYAGR